MLIKKIFLFKDLTHSLFALLKNQMRKTLFTIALLSLSYLGVRAFEPEFDEGVIVLGTSTFDAALAQYDNLLVEFYAPWW